jgi:hypothetical protein
MSIYCYKLCTANVVARTLKRVNILQERGPTRPTQPNRTLKHFEVTDQQGDQRDALLNN